MTPTKQTPLVQPEGHAEWLAQCKGQIAQAQQWATLTANAERAQLNRRIGRDNHQP